MLAMLIWMRLAEDIVIDNNINFHSYLLTLKMANVHASFHPLFYPHKGLFFKNIYFSFSVISLRTTNVQFPLRAEF